MIKKITLAVAVVLFAFVANAQIKLNVGGGLALPNGDFGDVFKTGYGLNLGGKYMLNENMAAGLNVGYFSFSAKDEIIDFYKILAGSDDVKYKGIIIPVTGSFTYYFGTEGFKPYAGLDLGFFMCKPKLEVDGEDVTKDAGLDSETKIGFAPTVGFEYNFSDNLGLDVNAKYNYISTSGSASTYIGVNVGIIYTLK